MQLISVEGWRDTGQLWAWDAGQSTSMADPTFITSLLSLKILFYPEMLFGEKVFQDGEETEKGENPFPSPSFFIVPHKHLSYCCAVSNVQDVSEIPLEEARFLEMVFKHGIGYQVKWQGGPPRCSFSALRSPLPRQFVKLKGTHRT